MKLFFQLYFDVDHIKFQMIFSKTYSHFIYLCYYSIRGHSHKGKDTLFKIKCKLMVIKLSIKFRVTLNLDRGTVVILILYY